MAAITTGTRVPREFRAGTTAPWTASYADHPASTWAGKYVFKKEGETDIAETATASGDSFAVTLTAAKSARFAPGRWKWFLVVSLVGTGETVADSGTVDVQPNPLAKHDPTFAERALAMVEGSLKGDLPTAQESYDLLGSNIVKMPINPRFERRERLKAEIAREREARQLDEDGDGWTPGLRVRFCRS